MFAVRAFFWGPVPGINPSETTKSRTHTFPVLYSRMKEADPSGRPLFSNTARVRLSLRSYGTHRADIRTCSAVNAKRRIDLVDIPFRNSSLRALVDTCTASDAVF